MGAPTRGEVVLVNFPFTDLTGRKLRPAVVVAAGDHCDDIILCQITSQDYGDREAVAIDPIKDFSSGSLAKDSYVRPRKLFTANDRLITRVVGKLKPSKLDEVAQAIIKAISGN